MSRTKGTVCERCGDMALVGGKDQNGEVDVEVCSLACVDKLNKLVGRMYAALKDIAQEHCYYKRGDTSCAETDVPAKKYCGSCRARAVLNDLKKRELKK